MFPLFVPQEEGVLDSDTPGEIEPEMMSEWEPDPKAIEEPENFRINIWDNTELGKIIPGPGDIMLGSSSGLVLEG